MSNEEVKIEEIKAKDNQAIYELIQEILESYGLDQPGTAYTDPYLNRLYEFYQEEERGSYWILKKNEQVIGGVGVSPFGQHEDVAELQKYYIKQDFQGQGYGRLLFEKVYSFAKKMNYKSIYIETNDVLEDANRIYEHFGFQLLDTPLAGSEHEKMNRWFLLKLNTTHL